MKKLLELIFWMSLLLGMAWYIGQIAHEKIENDCGPHGYVQC